MLTEREFNSWCDRNGLSSAAVETIREIRKSDPSRRVGGGRNNVLVYYPSRKMGCTIQAESHTNEFPLVYQYEFDDDVLEYYCQAPPIELRYLGPSGRGVLARHSPDYFVIRRKRAGWEEAKTESELLVLAKNSPNRYQLVGDCWECPPGKEHAEPFGLYYELRSSADIDPIFVRNAYFLDDYLRVDDPVPQASIDVVLQCLAEHPVMSLVELFAQTKDTISPDAIYQMIVASIIHVDLCAAPLVEPERVRIFADAETAAQFHESTVDDQRDIGVVDLRPRALLVWDGKPWTILNIGNNNVALLDEDKSLIELPLRSMESLLRDGRLHLVGGGEGTSEHPEVQRRLETASKADLKAANDRKALVDARLHPQADSPQTPMNRTERRYVSQYLEAEEAYGNGYIGLIPQTGRRGNRKGKLDPDGKLDEEIRSAMAIAIHTTYEAKKQTTRYSSWSEFTDVCEQQNLPCPSYWTYCKAIRARPRYEQTLKRKGRRAAYKDKEFYWRLDQLTPRHGDRPWEIAHIDHTELDVELISPETGKNLRRPWLTLLIDAFSRSILAHFISFDPPSYRSCMMVLRECVRRHNKLPQIIFVDGGAEFSSTYFDQVLGKYEVTKKKRPPADPRVGSVCERIFGTTNTEFIHNLQGNTQIMKDVRQVTKSVNPKGLAIWDLVSLESRLSAFTYDVYDTMDHPALKQSPRDAFNAVPPSHGARKHKYIHYDTAFLMGTAPTTTKGTAKVHPGRGIVVNYFFYWSEAFRDPLVAEHKVDVRYDPYDLGTAWAFVRGHWVECHSQYYSVMKGRSEREIKLASTIIAKQNRMYARGRMTLTASKLAAFLKDVRQDEEVQMQRLCDQEARRAREGSNPADRAGFCAHASPDEPKAARPSLTKEAFEELETYGAL